MTLSQVSFVNSNGDERKGLLVQFVHASMDGTYGMVMVPSDRRFYKIPYDQLTFDRWMD